MQADKILRLDNGDTYVGQLDITGRRCGHGRCDYAVGGSYTGAWADDLPHGVGERIYPSSAEDQHAGEVSNGLRLSTYKGEWVRGIPSGSGSSTYLLLSADAVSDSAWQRYQPQLSEYTGTFRNGLPHGIGSGRYAADRPPASVKSVHYFAAVGPSAMAAAETYAGEWVDGVPHGKGCLRMRCLSTFRSPTSARGATIDGEWVAGELVRGREELPGRRGIYDGQYRMGRRDGHGRLEMPDGSEYEGEQPIVSR